MSKEASHTIKSKTLTRVAFDLWNNGELRISILQPHLSSIRYKGEITLNKQEIKALKGFLTPVKGKEVRDDTRNRKPR